MDTSNSSLDKIDTLEQRRTATEADANQRLQDVGKLIRTVAAKRFLQEVNADPLLPADKAQYQVSAEELTGYEQQLAQAVETAITAGVETHRSELAVEIARRDVVDGLLND